MPEEATPARQIAESEIRAEGPITFARFMEIALYSERGYYTKSPDPRSDYATSPQIHPAFGALIASWLFKAWQALGQPTVFDVLEIGAGDGGLANDVLDAANGAPECVRFSDALRYRAYDIKPREAVSGMNELSDVEPIVGCVISNELLDAFPCHRFTIQDNAVLESYVGLDADSDLVFLDGAVSTAEISDRICPFVSKLPEGYRGEANLGIEKWASSIARVLKRGYVLTIDYGYERAALYHPGRTEGSLRCYRDHVLGQNPFRHVGEQDITAHVDFTAVDEALKDRGLHSVTPLQAQRDFLFDLGIGEYIRQVRERLATSHDYPGSYQPIAELRSLNALIDPRGLGAFKVAQHSFGAAAIDLADLEVSSMFSRPQLQRRHLQFLPYD